LKTQHWIILGLLAGPVACGVNEEARRAEVASVTVAIDRLRDAPNPAKSDFLVLLRKTVCTLPDVCALRDSCAKAYGKQVDALAQIQKLRAQGTPATDLAELYRAVQTQITEARDEAKTCVDNEAKIIDRYRAKSSK
jgi:hypothetical protein